MDCKTNRKFRDDYLDARLEPSLRQAVNAHLAECDQCAQAFREDRDLLGALQDLPVPPASEYLVERAMGQGARRERQRQRRWQAGGLAVAAGLLIAVVLGLVTQKPLNGTQEPPMVAVKPGQSQPVNLVFNSRRRMEGVTLSVEVPEGVEIANHPGKRRLNWQATLEPGQNLLRVPVIVRGEGGVLRANIRHGGQQKRLNVRLQPQQPDRSRLGTGQSA
ncbi:anti-sigma factor family protein [Thiohalorhabdus sp.]|uniref:anti-sigma factor family protein n=1 Tax=Thiohalorhabdus sp. TaxID=3094134 RepID=UPI002FC2D909